MSLFRLAWQNFLQHTRRYGALIFSLSFTVFVFFNFGNLEYSSSLANLSAENLQRIHSLIDVVKVVLICFMVSMIAYASHVFLKSQKKEIGVYVFLGLTNSRIGMMYVIENLMVGIVSILIGIATGALFSYLFSMVFVHISNLNVTARFSLSGKAALETCALFLFIYALVTLLGLRSIQKSSVRDLMSASRQNEQVLGSDRFLVFRAVLGCLVLGTAYFFAIKDGGMDVLANAMVATICVIVGTYLLFGGFLPFVLGRMQKNKKFLYGHRRLLWVDALAFRMRQNYRSYAMVCILLICAITALGCGFTLNHRISAMQEYSMQYDVQILSLDPDGQDHFDSLLAPYQMRTIVPVAQSNKELFIPYSSVAGFDLPKPDNEQCVLLSKGIIFSLYTAPDHFSTELNGKPLECIADIRTAVVGFMQDKMEVPLYVISDELFDQTFSPADRLYLYNYKLNDEKAGAAISTNDPMVTGIFKMNEDDQSYLWLNTIFTFCVFLFLVFLIAACSILFIKQYNDSFEDIEAYDLMRKIGVDRSVLERSIFKECSFQFGLDFVVMSVSSFFSLMALSKIAGDPLGTVFLVSNLIVLILIVMCDFLCVRSVQKVLLKNQ